ncbi:chromosome segregation protein [Actinobacillus genomosp. 2]|uniref:chromosome segregation protein n=1 Tax=Actinobacillus genomosp. 2 TaxID=230709 RepID=UPI002441041E|nr:chromosome segregation protein [Actinobacillus genomosp. 2]WGE32226.1 chromosome segregation protein [Actinobacillus genomosp. 2]
MFSLNRLYLLPNSYTFRFLSLLQTYFRTVCLSVFILIVSYPSYQYISQSSYQKELLATVQQLSQETSQKQRLYQSLSQHQNYLKEKEQYVSQLNQQLQSIFNVYQVKLEQMQWNLEQGKSIYFSLNHQVSIIFKLIKKLSKLKPLKFREIHLIKLEQEKQLQLQARVIVTEDKGE